jgi:preprotein translocase subunit SecD
VRVQFGLFTGLLSILMSIAVAGAEPLVLDIAQVNVTPSVPEGQMALSLDLTPESRQAFADFTTANVGKTVNLSIDGTVVMAPRIMEPITGGKLMVSGNFVAGEVERIARKILDGDVKVQVDVAAGQ